MLESTLQGPGWLMFFQDETDHYSWKEDLGKKKREENEIIAIIMALYETRAV